MKRSVVLGVAAAALLAAAAFVWLEVRQEREFRRFIAEGDAALAQDQTFMAVEAFSRAVALRPGSMLPYLKRGDSYRRAGEFAPALRDLRQANVLDPTAPQPIELLGDVNSAMRRHGRAAEHYERFIQLDDRSPRVLYKLAVARFRAGQAPAAIAPLQKAVALDDTFAEAHYLLGMVLRAEQRHDEALAALARAVALNPAFIAAHDELADLYAELGRVNDGLDELEAVAALDSGRAERLVTLGLAYARRGRADAAILTLGRAAERYPEAPGVYTALGRVWLDVAAARRDPIAVSKALEALQGIAAQPDATSETLALYGRALLLSGNAARAELTLQEAVRRPPVEPLAYRDLADAARRLGHGRLAADAAARYALLSGGS